MVRLLGKLYVFANLPFLISEILSVGSEVSIPSQQLLNVHYQKELPANNLQSGLNRDVVISRIMRQVHDVSNLLQVKDSL